MPKTYTKTCNQTSKCLAILTALPAVMLCTPVSGEILPPGGLATDLGVSLSDRPDLFGETEAQQVVPYSLSDDQGVPFYIGQIIHTVMRDPNDSTLSFAYQFINAPGSSTLGIENLTAGEFGGYDTEVAVITDLIGDTAPVDAVRTDDGTQVTFDFDTESRIEPNGTSFSFLVKTNAISFDDNGLAAISAFTAESSEVGSPLLAGGGVTIATFRPTGAPQLVPTAPPPAVAVPLPPAVFSAIPTLLGAAMYIRRFRKRQENA